MNELDNTLRAALNGDQIVTIDRSPDMEDEIEGYVVGLSEQFVLLHALDPNYINLNGYTALRMEDIRGCRIRDDGVLFVNRALKLKKIHPVPQPEINLSDLPALLRSANAYFPLVTIHEEIEYPDECHIGRVHELTDETVMLRGIDPAARWDEIEPHLLRDITRVDFGDGYADALTLVADHEAKSGESQ